MSSTATAPPGRPILCLVLDGHTPLERAEAALAGGVDWIQLRDRTLEAKPLYERAVALRAIADRANKVDPKGVDRAAGPVRLLVNRRIDVAWAVGSDGVHLGYDALPTGEARQLLGSASNSGWQIGVSTHAPAEVETARDAGASYAHLAPIFPPLSKAAGRPALGLDALRSACGRGLPVLAQGGIEAENAARVVEAGAAGVAVTGAILAAPDAEAAARALRDVLDGAIRAARGAR